MRRVNNASNEHSINDNNGKHSVDIGKDVEDVEEVEDDTAKDL